MKMEVLSLITSMLCFMAFLLIGTHFFPFQSTTQDDHLGFKALQGRYYALKAPTQMKGVESWIGVECFRSNIVHIKFRGLEFNGSLDSQISNFHKLNIFDVSVNKLKDRILQDILPNMTHSWSRNMAHHTLCGVIGDVFNGWENLMETSIKDNSFSDIIPEHFPTIPNLWIGDSEFYLASNYPPWGFSFDDLSSQKGITLAPTIESSPFKNYASMRVNKHKMKLMDPGRIAAVVVGLFLFGSYMAFAVAIHIKRIQDAKLKRMDGGAKSTFFNPFRLSRELTPTRDEENPQILVVNSSPMALARGVRPIRKERDCLRSFSSRYEMPPCAKFYSTVDIQSTDKFCEENRLIEGSLGSISKVELSDGQTLAVKNVNMVSLFLQEQGQGQEHEQELEQEQEQFLDVVPCVSRLKHPCIIHLLVYDYVRSLTWGLRIQIVDGPTQASVYIQSLPNPIVQWNLKVANILLADELMPRLCNFGLSILRPLISNDVMYKAFEMAISNCGYIALEHGQLGMESTRTDVCDFGISLLEHLTEKQPFDSLSSIEQQSLVKWPSCQFLDGSTSEIMVEPVLRNSFTPRILSPHANIISPCVCQPEKECRAPMSQTVEALTNLLPKLGINGGEVISLFNYHQFFANTGDICANKLKGGIPLELPQNLTHLKLSSNNLSRCFPHSLSNLKNLRHLNVSHNTLSGVICESTCGLQNLHEMDLSYNKIGGDLPSSFASLSHVASEYTAWDCPLEHLISEKRFTSPPKPESSAIEKYPSKRVNGHKVNKMALGRISAVVGGVALFAGFFGFAIARHVKHGRT